MSAAHDDDRHEIEPPPPPRALATRPGLRKFTVLLWAGFLGATVLTLALALMPEHWLVAPVTLDDQASLFGLLWLLSVIPALFAGVLFHHHDDPAAERRR